jgi:hypothetical protein
MLIRGSDRSVHSTARFANRATTRRQIATFRALRQKIDDCGTGGKPSESNWQVFAWLTAFNFRDPQQSRHGRLHANRLRRWQTPGGALHNEKRIDPEENKVLA